MKSQNKQNILFTSVLGPYGVDSYRSRFKNPMSLLSNQITRGQKYYTVQMCQRTFAFDMFGVNLNANTSAINFPQEKHLKAILKSKKWDRVGISSIVQNFESLLSTYVVIRKNDPNVKIDIGGHITTDELVIKDFIQRVHTLFPHEKCNVFRSECEEKILAQNSNDVNNWLRDSNKFGDGITFVKRDGLEYYSLLDGVGLKKNNVLFAPIVKASFSKKVMGLPVPTTSGGLIIPDLGCPMKCDFCATSHKFSGKFVHFLSSAEDILKVANAQSDKGISELFVLSENFSLNVSRLEKLLSLMEGQKRPHIFNVFSSANGLMRLGIENIVKLGFNFVWIGLEDSTGNTFKKTHGIDLKNLVNNLQEHGITVLGSTILGFEGQKESDLDKEIEYALTYSCVYNQFMLAMCMPGTILWKSMKSRGLIKKDFLWTDAHGQSIQNWHHPHISDDVIEKKLDNAFRKDFDELGPSLYRMIKVYYDGYNKTKYWKHTLVQMRRMSEKKKFCSYAAVLRVMHKDLKKMNHARIKDIKGLEKHITKELNLFGKIKAKCIQQVLQFTLHFEKKRYYASQKNKKVKDPKCSVTQYGNFSFKVPKLIPKVISAPDAVEININ